MIRCITHLATDRGIVLHLSPHAVERKLRLFYCACCRLRWDVLPAACRGVVEVVERHAGGWVGARAVRAARRIAQDAARAARPAPPFGGHVPAAWDAANAARLAVVATEVRLRDGRPFVQDGSPASPGDQVIVLRELFENPFRPVTIEWAWLTRTVVTLARAIRGEGLFELMPVLGDALQDAGCDHSELLDHCYRPGPHAPGCWLVDRLSEGDRN